MKKNVQNVTKMPGTRGRGKELKDGSRLDVYLDSASREIAARLGNGNVSAGIRAALAICEKYGARINFTV